MNHLHLECVGGASGDMVLGTLLALGAPRAPLDEALASLGLGPFHLHTETAASMHLTGLRARVLVEGQPEAGQPAEPVDAPDHHAHPHHHHHHDDEPAHDHDHDHAHDHHAHRALSEIERMIHAAALPAAVSADAIAVFRALGAAEAKIHGVPVEHIHFHEVGAADSILDIVGSCWCRHALGISTVSVGPIPLGHGVIRCAHGVYPNPAPATLELIAGLPVLQTGEPFELVTPTGAALLATWRTGDGPPPGARLVRAVYGLGQRALNTRPNVLRASLYTRDDDAAESEHDTCLELACTLDDLSAELVGAALDAVLAAGALDATCTPVTMKKQRPGVILTVLCPHDRRDAVLDTLFRTTTTFGVREHPVTRTKLARRFETVETPYGPVRIKIGSRGGIDLTRAPEYDDCARLARDHGVAVRAVYEAAARAG